MQQWSPHTAAPCVCRTGTLPTWPAQLPDLTALFVQQNNLSSSVPQAWCDQGTNQNFSVMLQVRSACRSLPGSWPSSTARPIGAADAQRLPAQSCMATCSICSRMLAQGTAC